MKSISGLIVLGAASALSANQPTDKPAHYDVEKIAARARELRRALPENESILEAFFDEKLTVIPDPSSNLFNPPMVTEKLNGTATIGLDLPFVSETTTDEEIRAGLEKIFKDEISNEELAALVVKIHNHLPKSFFPGQKSRPRNPGNSWDYKDFNHECINGEVFPTEGSAISRMAAAALTINHCVTKGPFKTPNGGIIPASAEQLAAHFLKDTADVTEELTTDIINFETSTGATKFVYPTQVGLETEIGSRSRNSAKDNADNSLLKCEAFNAKLPSKKPVECAGGSKLPYVEGKTYTIEDLLKAGGSLKVETWKKDFGGDLQTADTIRKALVYYHGSALLFANITDSFYANGWMYHDYNTKFSSNEWNPALGFYTLEETPMVQVGWTAEGGAIVRNPLTFGSRGAGPLTGNFAVFDDDLRRPDALLPTTNTVIVPVLKNVGTPDVKVLNNETTHNHFQLSANKFPFTPAVLVKTERPGDWLMSGSDHVHTRIFPSLQFVLNSNFASTTGSSVPTVPFATVFNKDNKPALSLRAKSIPAPQLKGTNRFVPGDSIPGQIRVPFAFSPELTEAIKADPSIIQQFAHNADDRETSFYLDSYIGDQFVAAVTPSSCAKWDEYPNEDLFPKGANHTLVFEELCAFVRKVANETPQFNDLSYDDLFVDFRF